MANRRFGWRSGSVHCKDVLIRGDIIVEAPNGSSTVPVAGNQLGYLEVKVGGATRYIPLYDDINES
jgi:hypothetical protein